MVVQRGSPRATSYFHISDNLYIKFDNNDKKGNLGNQWQSLISSLEMSSSYNILSSNSLFSMSVFWPLIIPEVIQLKIKRSTCFARQSYFSNVPQICVSPVIILDEFLGLSVVAKKCCRHRQPGRLSPPPAAFQVNSVVTSIIRSTEYGQHVVFFYQGKELSSK